MATILSITFDEAQLELLRACTIEELRGLDGLLDRLQQLEGHVQVTAADIEIPGSIDLHTIVDELRRLGPEQLQALAERHVGNPFAGERGTVDQRISGRAYGILLDHPSLTYERALFLARQELTGVADDASAEVEDEAVAGLPAKVARYRTILEKSRMKPSVGRTLPAKAKQDDP